MKFWRGTGAPFFMAFAAALLIESLNRSFFLFMERPNEGSPIVYLVRLLAFMLILIAIVRKNRGQRG